MARRRSFFSPKRILFKLFSWLLLLFFLAFIAMFAYQLFLELTLPEPKGEAEAIIVLGAQVKEDGTPSVQLELRLQKALEVYKQKPRTLIVCGAQGKKEPEPEAHTMQKWLIAHGVSAEHILVDDKSVDTRQSIDNAITMVPEGTKIAIVTSDYHLPRAIRLANDAGVKYIEGIASPIKSEYWLKNHVREALAWGKYFLYKFL